MNKPLDLLESDLSKCCIPRRSYYGDYRRVSKILREKGFELVKRVRTSYRITTSYNPLTRSPLCSISDYDGKKFDRSRVVSVITTIAGEKRKVNVQEIWALKDDKKECKL